MTAPAQPEQKPCAQCNRVVSGRLTRGRCESCYKRFLQDEKLAGTFQPLIARPRRPLADRIRDHVEVDDNGCWLFNGTTDPDGYARIRDQYGRKVRAHRASYTEFVGPIPEGLDLDHLCSVRRCVNPSHLEPVTNLVNTQRGLQRRAETGQVVLRQRKTACARGHEFTPANTISGPHGYRACRTCKRAADARRRDAKKR